MGGRGMKQTTIIALLIVFIAGLSLGYAWSHTHCSKRASKVCQTIGDSEVCIYYNETRADIAGAGADTVQGAR